MPEDGELDILFEDECLIVINKSAGIVVHPSAGHPSGTIVNFLLHHCGDLSGISGVLRPGIVLVEDGGTTMRYFVQGGFADVTPDGLTILAEQALAVDGDDKDALQDAVTEARSRVEAETDEQKKAEAESILRVLEEIQ